MKRHYCASPVVFILGCIGATFLAVAGYVIAAFALGKMDDNLWLKWGGFAGALLIIVFVLVAIPHFVRKRIQLTQTEISVRTDSACLGVFRKLQYIVEVKFSEIAGLSYIFSTTDSLGKGQFMLLTPMPYLVFICKDGRKKRINLYYFSKGQRRKIIREVLLRAAASGNPLPVTSAEELMKR